MEERNMMKIKMVDGYLDICYEDTAIFSSKEMNLMDMITYLDDFLKEFNGRKVRITIEDID